MFPPHPSSGLRPTSIPTLKRTALGAVRLSVPGRRLVHAAKRTVGCPVGSALFGLAGRAQVLGCGARRGSVIEVGRTPSPSAREYPRGDWRLRRRMRGGNASAEGGALRALHAGGSVVASHDPPSDFLWAVRATLTCSPRAGCPRSRQPHCAADPQALKIARCRSLFLTACGIGPRRRWRSAPGPFARMT